MNNQVYIDDAAGKLIQKVFQTEDRVLIVYADRAFSLIVGYVIDDYATVEDGDFRLSAWAEHADELRLLGIVTQEQCDAHKADVAMKSQKEKDERRELFERLKAEFHGY